MFSKPTLQSVSPKSYEIDLALDKIKTGVDNVRYDVLLSPGLKKSVCQIITSLITKYSGCDNGTQFPTDDFKKFKKNFQDYCKKIMADAISTSKHDNTHQLDTLALVAIIKWVQSEIKSQFANFSENLKDTIRNYEASAKKNEVETLKKKTFLISQNRNEILFNVSQELFSYLKEVQISDFNQMRQVSFGGSRPLPDDFFGNKLFFTENPTNDFFTLEHYKLLLGHRLEDPDKYNNIISLISNLLISIHEIDVSKQKGQPEAGESFNIYTEVNDWLKCPENIDILFNFYQSRFQQNQLKRGRATDEYKHLKQNASEQKRRLHYFYKHFKKNGLIKKIIAAYEIQPVYLDYCPPLVPHLVSQFLISSQARKNGIERLRQMKKIYGKNYNVKPLQKKRFNLKFLRQKHKKGYLIRFLKDLFLYHRDYENYMMVQKATEQVHLVEEEKLVQLSRINNSLYEFLLPHERASEKKPILNHVIIKADVRGSTDITHRMLKKNLNPATYFSLNFFDPITEVMADYGARKVFVEGDAIILSIFERENEPDGWYSVARACGMASEILTIVQNCNLRNQRHHLPPIELGIGITFRDKRPAFLYDGEQRIMISSAINIADRLSGCSKPLKRHMAESSDPFHLYVFQSLSDEDMSVTSDDLFMRYNVNGIELSREGYQKLTKEIKLKRINVAIGQSTSKKTTCFYTGMYPLVNGEYRRLVIREDKVLRIDPVSLQVLGQTSRNYYEVCTHPKLIQYMNRYFKRTQKK